jgi:hypothetical protein
VVFISISSFIESCLPRAKARERSGFLPCPYERLVDAMPLTAWDWELDDHAHAALKAESMLSRKLVARTTMPLKSAIRYRRQLALRSA